MTDRNIGRWLLVALAIAGLAFAAPVVSAHGDDPVRENETAAEDTPFDGAAAERGAWMDRHLAGQMGPNAVDEMEAHMGVTVGEMARDMADDDHPAAGMNGRGYGC